MMMSSMALMNSCAEGLQLLLNEGLKPKDMNGLKIFLAILQKVHSPSISKMGRLKAQLRAMNLKTFSAENVTCGEAMPLVREIKMNSMSHDQFSELTIDSLQGLRKCSDQFLAHKVNDLMMDNDYNRGKIGNKKSDARFWWKWKNTTRLSWIKKAMVQ
jgi:hypothetical protein